MRHGFAILLTVLSLTALTASADPTSVPENEIVFMGSSTIQFWETLESDFPEYKTVNLGVWGSDFDDLLHDTPRFISENPAPRFVIYSGDNDIAQGDPAEKVALKFQNLVTLIHASLPQARVYVISIKPCPDRAAHIPEVRSANALIERFVARNAYITYVDVFNRMLTDDGQPKRDLFRDDGLHLNASGYRLWKQVLRAVLKN